MTASTSIESLKERSPSKAGVGAWMTLALLFTLYTLSFIDRKILALVIEPLKIDLLLTDVQVGLLIGTAFAITYAALGLPLSYIADKWNRRNLIAIGVAVWSISTALGGLAQSFWALFIFRMGVGLGEAALSPAAYSMIGDKFPAKRLGVAMSIYTMGAPVGVGLAWIIGGVAVESIPRAMEALDLFAADWAPWRIVLIVVGLPGVLLAACMMLVKEPPRTVTLAGELQSDADKLLTVLWRRRYLLLPIFLGQGMFAMAAYGVSMWMPSFFEREHGLPPGQTAVALGGIFSIMGITGMLAGGLLADALWKRGVSQAHLKVLALSAAITCVFFTAAWSMPTTGIAFAVIAVAIFGQSLQGGLPAVVLHQVTSPQLKARIVACYLMFHSLLGLGVGPLTVALVNQHAFGGENLGLAMTIASAVLLSAATILLLTAVLIFRRTFSGAPDGQPSGQLVNAE